MGQQSPDEIITKIIRFIKKEREIYGDFSGSPDPARKIESQKNNDKKPGRSATTANRKRDEAVPKRSGGAKQVSNTKSRGQPMNYFDSQESLFNQDESREIYYKIGKCETLEELEQLCKQAEVLKTDLEGTNLVFGVGNPAADLVLVGEAPGAEEDKQEEPFVGKAGRLLNKILSAINFERNDVYIANILKHRPPNNRNPLPEERKKSLPFLLRQIDLINPKLILSLGKVSAQTLLNNDGSLSSMRGSFHSFRGTYELLATYHPAALLRHPKWKRPTWEDVRMLRERYDELGGKP